LRSDLPPGCVTIRMELLTSSFAIVSSSREPITHTATTIIIESQTSVIARDYSCIITPTAKPRQGWPNVIAPCAAKRNGGKPMQPNLVSSPGAEYVLASPFIHINQHVSPPMGSDCWRI